MRTRLAEYLQAFLFSLHDFFNCLRSRHVLNVERAAGDFCIVSVSPDMTRFTKCRGTIVPGAIVLASLANQILLDYSGDFPVFTMKRIDGGWAEPRHVSHRGVHGSIVITEDSLLPAANPCVPYGRARLEVELCFERDHTVALSQSRYFKGVRVVHDFGGEIVIDHGMLIAHFRQNREDL